MRKSMGPRKNRRVCDAHRPTAAWDRFELRGGTLIVGCQCNRHDGMQHECKRTQCMGRPECLAQPVATCRPSQPCPKHQLWDDDDDDDDENGNDKKNNDDKSESAASLVTGIFT